MYGLKYSNLPYLIEIIVQVICSNLSTNGLLKRKHYNNSLSFCLTIFETTNIFMVCASQVKTYNLPLCCINIRKSHEYEKVSYNIAFTFKYEFIVIKIKRNVDEKTHR